MYIWHCFFAVLFAFQLKLTATFLFSGKFHHLLLVWKELQMDSIVVTNTIAVPYKKYHSRKENRLLNVTFFPTIVVSSATFYWLFYDSLDHLKQALFNSAVAYPIYTDIASVSLSTLSLLHTPSRVRVFYVYCAIVIFHLALPCCGDSLKEFFSAEMEIFRLSPQREDANGNE